MALFLVKLSSSNPFYSWQVKNEAWWHIHLNYSIFFPFTFPFVIWSWTSVRSLALLNCDALGLTWKQKDTDEMEKDDGKTENRNNIILLLSDKSQIT